MKPQLLSAQDDYPFGSLMPGRSYNANLYRFGFNGQEKDDEVFGSTGSWLNLKYRGYDSLVVRFFAIDPLTKNYPSLTPYQFASLNPIWMIELEGLDEVVPRSQLNGMFYMSELEVSDWGQIGDGLQTSGTYITRLGIVTPIVGPFLMTSGSYLETEGLIISSLANLSKGKVRDAA